MWCVPELNAEYIERMEEVLEIYERPYNPQEPVVCLDEKPVVLHGEIRSEKRARPGTLAKRDYEYKRRGGANVFCAVEAKAGRSGSYKRLKGIPCEVDSVRRLEPHWYSVVLGVNEWWDRCGTS